MSVSSTFNVLMAIPAVTTTRGRYNQHINTQYNDIINSIKGILVALSISDIQHKWHSALKHSGSSAMMLSVVILSAAIYLLLCWVSLCWVLLCWMSLCWVSLCWMLWRRYQPQVIKHVPYTDRLNYMEWCGLVRFLVVIICFDDSIIDFVTVDINTQLLVPLICCCLNSWQLIAAILSILFNSSETL